MMSSSKRVEIESSGVIDAPVEAVWELVSDFSNVVPWHPDVTECRIVSGSSTEAGAVRRLRLRNGVSIRGRLIAISPQDRFYTYSVTETPLPIRDHESTVRLKPLSTSRTQVQWTAQFDVIEGDPNTLADGVKAGVLDLGIDGLRRAATSK
jgi:hypothetical protein